MSSRSLPRRVFVRGGLLLGAGYLLSACGVRLPTDPENDQEPVAKFAGTAVTPATRYTIPVSWAISCSVLGAMSPLQALKASGHQYVLAPNYRLVQSIDRVSGDWIFTVDDLMPDDYWITGIGNVPITSPREAQAALSRFSRGQLKVATTNNKGSLPSGSVTADTIYAPTLASGRLLITWLRVGAWC